LDADVARLSVSTSADHTCATKIDGSVVCWGDNSAGQLGDGTTVDRGAPVAVDVDWQGQPFGDAVELCASPRFTCARKSDGSAWCWGNVSPRPRRLPLGAPVGPGGMACGRRHACFAAVDGTVWCAGENDSGQIGAGAGAGFTLSVQVPGIDEVVRINAGRTHTCATRADGTLWCWGADSGLFSTALSSTPTEIPLAIPSAP
jgi:alpha-tubulin suppressor-like RCC1 family protein